MLCSACDTTTLSPGFQCPQEQCPFHGDAIFALAPEEAGLDARLLVLFRQRGWVWATPRYGIPLPASELPYAMPGHPIEEPP